MDTLVATTLEGRERRAVERIIERLGEELGENLLAVWLYGSRARGEPPGPDSDIDLLVITHSGDADQARVSQTVDGAVSDEGLDRFVFRVIVVDPAWIGERRAVEAFFIQRVDRDKLVLAGSGGEDWPPAPFARVHGESGMRRRTEELLAEADETLRAARAVLTTRPPSTVSLAYYSVFYAASAALSEEDLSARGHDGTWHFFHEHLVATGRFDSALAARGPQLQELREKADYGGWRPEPGEPEAIIQDAERFLEHVERLLR